MVTLQGGYDVNTETNQSALKRRTLTDVEGDKTGADSTLFGYYPTSGTWLPVKVNSNGELVIALSNP